MMTVLEYAEDMNKSVEDVLSKCKLHGIMANKENDELDDEAIVILDNAWEEDLEADASVIADIEFEEQVEEMLESKALKVEDSPSKGKNGNNKDKKNIASMKKEMYKHKTKLVANTVKNNEKVVLYEEGMTIEDLAKAMGETSAELVKKLMMLGHMTTKNSPITFDDAEVLVTEFGKELKLAATVDIHFDNIEADDNPEDLQPRPAVVTIMGHVDHGKTTLLDAIRKSNVCEGEAGGITQHIGAYQIAINDQKITFIDTPGHAAFTEMRARGASVTDIVIIIVAADDGIMPQTKEVIDHAKAAKVPIIVAINKIDKEGANPDRIMQEMSEYGLVSDTWGGDTLFVKISAKHDQGIDDLLNNILLIAEMQELKANPNRYAMGTVIEAKQDKASGNIITLLVQNGTLRLGDPIVIGETSGKVRTLKNDMCEEIVSAAPSMPVEITGVSEMPKAGDKFMAFETEKEAKNIACERREQNKLTKNKPRAINFDDIFNNIQGGMKELNVVLKTDVHGSEEAVKNALLKIDVEGVKINVIHSGVGTITEGDVVLANASNALVLGFNVRPNAVIRDLAKSYGVDIHLYGIIYQLIEEVEKAMTGMLDPIYEESILGTAEVRRLFKFSKVGAIAGSMVTDGLIKSHANARLIRDGVVVIDTKISTLQREKDQAKEVKKGYECGITLEDYDDIKEGDIVEVYEMVEVKRK